VSKSILTVQNINSSSKQQLVGLSAALITVLIWASYFLSLKVGSLTALTLIELSLFRYAVPALVLLPIFIKSINEYKKVPKVYLFGVILGGGLPFFLLSGYAVELTQVAYGSTLIPGVAPLFVTFIAVWVYKQAFPTFRKWGLFLIVFGVFCMLFYASSNFDLSLLLGQNMLILCAISWALFTISIRQSGLAPLKVASLASLPNGFIIVLWILFTQPELGYSQLSMSELLGQIVVQGLIVGICSGICFSAAIVRIGAEKTAALGAITPVVATFFAVVFLGEQVYTSLLIGMILVISGVVVASGVFHGERVS